MGAVTDGRRNRRRKFIGDAERAAVKLWSPSDAANER
jgi:hypothetical protein